MVIIRSFKVERCYHHDRPAEKPEKPESIEIEEEEKEVVIDEKTFENREMPPELQSKTEEINPFDIPDQVSSSSDSDDIEMK